MEQPANTPVPREETGEIPSRRRLIKLLAAAGGAVALSSLPNQWKTPVVEVGALPAHAQVSREQVAF
jgi:hypothetical protein